MIKNTVDLITMGCSKNLVDTERLMASLGRSGYKTRHNPHDVNAEIAVVNTCGFIGDAKEESIEMILDLANAKKQGKIKKLLVMGCLSERYMKELQKEIPEVDSWFGKFNWNGIVKEISGKEEAHGHKPWERVLTTFPHSAYVKISEGCNRRCAFCAIPLITGPHKSRPAIEILDEVKNLRDAGVKEFNIIAQDLSSYGTDISHRQELPALINDMARLEGVEWIRLHYAYPAQFPLEVLDVMRENANVCNYLDIALQHISDPVLTNMRRNITSDETYRLIEKIREKVPGIHLRTTLMVGFPGEGEKEFGELMKFVAEVRFERMGAFAYCEEEDTWGAKKFKDLVPPEEKERRLDTLMQLQEEISNDIQQLKVGNTYKVLVDREEDGKYIGRTQWDSPEVDPEVIIDADNLTPGRFYEVGIKQATPFELYGEVRQ